MSEQHNNRGAVLDEAIKIINGERQTQYGDPEDSFALISRYWNSYINQLQVKTLVQHGFDPDDYKLVDMIKPKDVAMMMVLLKIARESNQEKLDNLVDAAGYLGIAGDMKKE